MSKTEEGQKKKKKRGISSVILLVLMLACLGVFGFSAYKIFSQKAEDHEGEAVYEEINKVAQMDETRETVEVKPAARPWAPTGGNPHLAEEDETAEEETFTVSVVDFEALRAKNREIVAWIEVPDTIISYPVVQAENNDKYLRHLLDGSYHRFGTLFFDYRHDLSGDVVNDDITYIYGHNIRAGNMFHVIQFYTRQSYYEEHPYGLLYMPGAVYKMDFFALVTISAYDDMPFHYPENAQGYLDRLKNRSHFSCDVEVTAEDRVVGLFTCTNEDESERYILYGKLTPLERTGE